MAKGQQAPRTQGTPSKDSKAPKAPKAPKEPKRKPHPTIAGLTELQHIDVVPPDFDFELHAGIKPKTFSKKAGYLEYKAAEHEHKARKLREAAALDRQFGDTETRKAVSKLSKMQSKLAEMSALLKDQGIDVDAILRGALAEKPTA